MEENKSDRLGTEPIVPLLLKLSIPSILGMAIQALYNVVDSIYIGRVSTEALSALSLAFPIQMVLIAIAVGTGVGTSSLISRLLGEKKEHRANNVAEHVIFVTIVYGIIAALVGFFFTKEIFTIFTQDPILLELGVEYTKIIFIGSLAMFFPMIANNILRGEGNTIMPMVTLLIGAILNIILDPFFIFGIGIFPELGVAGAAYATVISRIISGLFILFILFSDKNQIKLKLEEFQFDLSIIKGIYQVGFPAMIMQLLASVMIAGVNMIVGGYNLTAIAVMGVYFRLQSFVFMPVFGLNQGFMPIVGYNYGHNNPQRMKKTIKYSILIAFSFTTAGLIVFQLFPKELLLLFNKDQELLSIGEVALRRISLAFPIIGPAIIGSTTFQAIGKGFPSLLLSFLRQMILLLPIMYILGELFGLDALWFSFPISELIATILMIFWLKSTLKEVFSRMRKRNLAIN
ncbi:MATE family efflux transporter [Orenia metallireducens]|jgi:putative MATE family efflux protein|uniref:MATE family efflux transporter n=1 Tax=Orenia metallireducens TaxID=1413210 RepID=A0A1C0A8R3_9FIRM|nr:MATE family efflux transporter [Orenia metallireducens]OCL26653.1 MATE family efflux transporter [Orenia metallireducens]